MLYVFIFLCSLFIIFTVSSPMFAIGTSDDLGNTSTINKTSFYICQDYNEYLQCDLTKNEFVGFSIGSTNEEITPITRDPNYVDGVNGKAVEFRDRYRDFIEISNNDAYKSDVFSISFWVKKIDAPIQSEPFAHVVSHTTFNQREGWFFNTNGAQEQAIRFGLTTNTGNEPIMSKPLPISNSSFTNIAATFNGSEIQLYRNGSLFDSIVYNGTYAPTQNLPVHIAIASFCSECNKFQGVVDDVRFYNRSLTSTEVSQLYSNNNNYTFNGNESLPISSELVGHWTFDNTLNDSSINENDGQMLTMVSSMASSPDGRIFISEKNTGNIRILQNDTLLDRPFAVINDSNVNWETGLLGLAIDPEFESNHFVYLYYSSTDIDDDPINRVVRFTEKDNLAYNMTVILDNIPSSRAFHAGGALAFGSDSLLYIGVGDSRNPNAPQNESSWAGKILRINKDGTIPRDNPFPYSPVYTMGHRNIFGIAFNEKAGIGIFTENGDKLYDEVNIIKEGGNYGFPTIQLENQHWKVSNTTIDIKPLRAFHNTIAPTQAIYYASDHFPYLKDTFLFGTYTGDIYSIEINNKTRELSSEINPHNDPESIVFEQHVQLENYPFESVVGLTQTPNGDIYYGGYHVHKLISIDVANPHPILFPLRLEYPDRIIVDDVFAEIQKYVIVDIQNTDIQKQNDSQLNVSNSFSQLKIKIPKTLLSQVGNINATLVSSTGDESTYNIRDYILEATSPRDNELSIPIPNNSTTVTIRIDGQNL